MNIQICVYLLIIILNHQVTKCATFHFGKIGKNLNNSYNEIESKKKRNLKANKS